MSVAELVRFEPQQCYIKVINRATSIEFQSRIKAIIHLHIYIYLLYFVLGSIVDDCGPG